MVGFFFVLYLSIWHSCSWFSFLFLFSFTSWYLQQLVTSIFILTIFMIRCCNVATKAIILPIVFDNLCLQQLVTSIAYWKGWGILFLPPFSLLQMVFEKLWLSIFGPFFKTISWYALLSFYGFLQHLINVWESNKLHTLIKRAILWVLIQRVVVICLWICQLQVYRQVPL